MCGEQISDEGYFKIQEVDFWGGDVGQAKEYKNRRDAEQEAKKYIECNQQLVGTVVDVGETFVLYKKKIQETELNKS